MIAFTKSNSRQDGPSLRSIVFFRVVTVVLLVPQIAMSDDAVSFDGLQKQYRRQIQPLLKQFCLECHSTEAKEGELDLERFAALDDVRRDPPAWQKVAGMLDTQEMPPEESPQPTADQKKRLRDWVGKYLRAEAHASAGDPGPVVLRRLNNAEFTYTVRDLTGVPLDPARDFPVDSAAGEGFTNTGDALVMSPALVTKYLEAGKEIAGHAILLPAGIRFSAGNSRRDWTDEILAEIRSLYARHTGRLGDANSLNRWNVSDPTQLTDADGRVDLERYFAALIRHRQPLLDDVAATDEIAKSEKLNPKYLQILARMLVSDEPSSLLLDRIRKRWREANAQDAAAIAGEVRAWQNQLWKFNPVGHFGRQTGWQQSAVPLVESQSFQLKLEKPADGDTVTLFLAARSANDANGSDIVAWHDPQFVRAGRPPILLRDLRATSIVLERMRRQALSATSKYLAAAFEARTGNKQRDLAKLAMTHGVDPVVLKQWLGYLGVTYSSEVKISQYLSHPIQSLAGYDFVKGWGLPNLDALSLIGNASDDKVNIPGDLHPHTIAVHPRSGSLGRSRLEKSDPGSGTARGERERCASAMRERRELVARITPGRHAASTRLWQRRSRRFADYRTAR